MLDPAWAATRPLLWIALITLIVLLVLRTIRKGRRDYQRFKRYRGTVKRQAMLRKWLRESWLTFGGISAGVLLLAGSYVGPLLAQLHTWAGVRGIRSFIVSNLWIVGAVLLVIVVLTWLGVRAARRDGDGIMAIGDIHAMLPRNRQELRLGALLSLNAGLVEELAFRLAIPALVFGLLAIPTAAIFGCQKGWPRLAMLAITLSLAAVGLTAAALIGFVHPPKNSPASALAGGSFSLFLIGTFISQWVANWLSQQKPSR